jgi:hypothetical protein
VQQQHTLHATYLLGAVAAVLLLQLALQAKRVAVLGIKTEEKVSSSAPQVCRLLRQHLLLHSNCCSAAGAPRWSYMCCCTHTTEAVVMRQHCQTNHYYTHTLFPSARVTYMLEQ